MFIEERHKEILTILNREGSIKAREIQEKFSVGFDTARRDLRLLEDKGLLKRTHGGAIPIFQVGFTTPPMYTPRDITEVKANYWAIAREAIKCINHNDVIYLTPASVGFFMARKLPTEFDFTVVTNSIIIADELRRYNNVTTLLLGGVMTKKGQLRNHFTMNMIRSMRFDKAFITAAAYSSSFGMSIQTSDSVSVIQAVIESSRKNIGLFPHEKMGRVSTLKICPPEQLQTLITDWDTSQDEINNVRELGVEVITSSENGIRE